MIDHEIKMFYDSVKGQDWPDIQSYIDFTKLPDYIKQECVNDFNIEQRKKEIGDVNHWAIQTVNVLTHKNLAFVPVPKCASTHYINVFKNLGWVQTPLSEVDVSSTKFFGVIQHPQQRHIKGLTEFITSVYANPLGSLNSNPQKDDLYDTDYTKIQEHLSAHYTRKLIAQLIVTDIHTIPYHSAFGDFLYKVNWIPMDAITDQQQVEALENFCELHGTQLSLLNQERTHTSSKDKNKLCDVLSELTNNSEYRYLWYKLFSNDLAFYYNLLDKFSVDWSHLRQ